jgi:hypothetical protein
VEELCRAVPIRASKEREREIVFIGGGSGRARKE